MLFCMILGKSPNPCKTQFVHLSKENNFLPSQKTSVSIQWKMYAEHLAAQSIQKILAAITVSKTV